MLNYFALLLCEAIPRLCYNTDKGLLASDGRECVFCYRLVYERMPIQKYYGTLI